MNEPTIHLEPVTQTVEDNTFFVGIPVTAERVPVSMVLFGINTTCARNVFLAPVVNMSTGAAGVGVYVHDHHGAMMMSNIIDNVPMFGDLSLSLN